MHRQRLVKPDGRELLLYGRAPFPHVNDAPVPAGDGPGASSSHLRWHPLRGEWVIYAGHRQHRTFLPPSGWNPLAPSRDPEQPTEVPVGAWEAAVFENRFAALSDRGGAQPLSTDGRPARGRCEVVVFTQDSKASLGALEPERVALIVDIWAERTAELGARDDVQHVMPFENRGVEVGVTLHHPHGQIYAYPFVPPVVATHVANEREFLARTGTTLLVSMIKDEVADGGRLLHDGTHAVSFVPTCARYPFEIWIAPRRRAARLDHLEPAERHGLAHALRDSLRRLDGLWSVPMPYVLIVHQAPTDGDAHVASHVHIQIYPALRMPGRLKYLAGSEIGAGAFTADVLPEAAAAQLRAVEEPRT
ncbi:MAG TPA: galactose-1-phosphate uridylyltransferase [Kofleriaceae bacterium]|nr:galactose-1-phosphate uridylyltransferase [Kofleriaceae bacterium]